MKYKLPEVAQLKELGFEFEFNTIKDAIMNIKRFVKKNKPELIELFFPGLDADEYEDRQKYINCNSDPTVTEILKAKFRISRGKITKQDYMWVVPPWLKDNKSVLMNVYQNRLEKYMIDSKLAFYDWSYLGISRKKAFKLVLQNELLRLIIKNLPPDPIGDIKKSKKLKKIKHINRRIKELKNRGMKYMMTGNELLSRACFHNATKLEWKKYELTFLIKNNVRQKAGKTLDKIITSSGYDNHTSIAEKENLIRQYIKLQTHQIRKAKNSRGAGLNSTKKKSVLLYNSENPDASISEIARQCNMDRKTVRKYLKA